LSLPLISIKDEIFRDNKIKFKTNMLDELLYNYDGWVVKDEWISMLYRENRYPVSLSVVLLKFIPRIVIKKIIEEGDDLW
jgi:hypothetical protein